MGKRDPDSAERVWVKGGCISESNQPALPFLRTSREVPDQHILGEGLSPSATSPSLQQSSAASRRREAEAGADGPSAC